MHYSQPFSGKIRGSNDVWGWDLDSHHEKIPKMVEENGINIICLDPWKWFDHVVEKYSQYPEPVELNDSRKIGQIHNIEGRQKSSPQGSYDTHQSQSLSHLHQEGTDIRNP